MLILASLVLFQTQSIGLNPGESLVELPPMLAPADPGLRHGRVRDALTGQPIHGATVETWTEENDARTGGFFRMGEGTSGMDGRFVVQSWLGGHSAEKIRVQASGYLTYSGTLGDLSNSMVLFPAPDKPTRFQVLDMLDRPLSGVVITSTISCAHDVPAFTERTNSLGWAELKSFGFQDDVQELRLRAQGFGAIKYLDADDLFQQTPATVRLGQRTPVSYTLAKKDGSTWAGATLFVLDGDGHHTLRSDAEGRFTIPSRYGNWSMGLYSLEAGEQRYLATIPTVPGLDLHVRDQADEWPEDTPSGTLSISGFRPGSGEIWACHRDGWLEDISDKDCPGLEFPAGEGFLLVGRAFSGFAPTTIPFTLAAGESLELAVSPEPEPRVTLRVPDTEFSTIRVQAHHETREGPPLDEAFPVPANQQLCFLFEYQGEVRRVVIDAAQDGHIIDLRPESTIVQAAPVDRELGLARFSIPTGSKLEVYSPGSKCEALERNESETITVQGPVGSTFLVRLSAAGHANTWRRAHIGPDKDSQAASLQLNPLASLRLHSNQEFQVAGMDSDDLESLVPGLLNLVITTADGNRIGLQIDLKPGEQRRIDLDATH